MKITKRQLRRIIKEVMTNAKKIAAMLLSGNSKNVRQSLMLAKNLGMIERKRTKDYFRDVGWGMGMFKELNITVIDPELINEIDQFDQTLSEQFRISYHWLWEVRGAAASLSFHVWDEVSDWGEDAKAPKYDDKGIIK